MWRWAPIVLAGCGMWACASPPTPAEPLAIDVSIPDVVQGDDALADVPSEEVDAPAVEIDDDAEEVDSAPEVADTSMTTPCTDDSDCDTGLCLTGEDEGTCAEPCGLDDACPAGLFCAPALGLCLPQHASLCAPCDGSDACDPDGSGAVCVDFEGEAAFCATSCAGGCPEGTECAIVTKIEGSTVERCVPTDGALCPCEGSGGVTPCAVTNVWGTCEGVRTCDEAGLGPCSAEEPAPEVCGGGDENCDGAQDEEDAGECTFYWADEDGDGLGGDAFARCLCAPDPPYTAWVDGDCDDGDPAITTCTPYYADPDGDGYGDPDDSACLCAPEAPYSTQEVGCKEEDGATIPCTEFLADVDGDGLGGTDPTACLCEAAYPHTTTVGGDCDDGDSGLGLCEPVYTDGDSDGFGAGPAVCVCAPSEDAWSAVEGDCDDDVATVYPEAPEFCDGLDNDCDALTDEADGPDCQLYFWDGDGDGYGIPTEPVCTCGAYGQFTATNDDDCNDLDPAVYPGQPCADPVCVAFVISGMCPDGICGAVSAPEPCPGGFTCLDEASCRTTCTEQAHCQPDHWCDGGTCAPQQPDGGPCTESSQCVAGYCQGGLCCAGGTCCLEDATCDDGNVCTLDGCTDAFQCVHSTLDGAVCEPAACEGDLHVAAGLCDGDICEPGAVTSCAGDDPCVADTCDPDGGCDSNPAPTGTLCATPGCSGFELTGASFCDGEGLCAVGADVSVCPNSYVCLNDTACRTSCSDNSHCQPDSYCAGGVCAPLIPQGGFCDEDSDCDGGNCDAGQCCDGCCDFGTVGTSAQAQAVEICDDLTYVEDGHAACSRIITGFGGFSPADHAPLLGDVAMVQLSTGMPAETGTQNWGEKHSDVGGGGPNYASSYPDPDGSASQAYDLCAFEVTLVVPPQAKGFAVDFIFFSAEYPEWLGYSYNDSFNIMLSSENINGNVAFDSLGNPISINNVLFDICNGCATSGSTLAGTGYSGGVGGATGWLTTTVPVLPGETITLGFYIYDEGDSWFDSDVLINNFRWLESQPGTGPVTE